MTTNSDDPQPSTSPPWDTDLQAAPPSVFVANGGYIYLVLFMAFVIGTIYFCRVFAAKREERLRLLKEQDMVSQFQDSNGINPPLYDQHERDIPVIIVVEDDGHGYGPGIDPAPLYTAQIPSSATGSGQVTTATTAEIEIPTATTTTTTTADRHRHHRRSSRPIELQPVGPQTTTAHLVAPAAVMVRGEPYSHILTPRIPSPAPRSTSLVTAPSPPPPETHFTSAREGEDHLSPHGQPPAYNDIVTTRQSMMVPATRIGIGHQYPPGPGQRPLSKP
ncbi:hypothetical protein DFQ26_003681 [Actinomortierella ambigua]|nr:hypothetical protein DFQ26_003681 [Actinomortierella ambigua]